jgi:hypothetical protein
MPIKCESFRPRRTASLRGFCDVLLVETGLHIRDVGLFEKDGRRWVMLPGRPQVNREGHLLKEPDGKVKYATILQFEREQGDAFTRAVIAAVLEQHPNVFDGDGGEQ